MAADETCTEWARRDCHLSKAGEVPPSENSNVHRPEQHDVRSRYPVFNETGTGWCISKALLLIVEEVGGICDMR